MSDFYETLRQADAYSKEGRTIEEVTRLFGYPADVVPEEMLVQGFSYVVLAPCGCRACDDGVQQGHFACSTPPAAMLQAEARGLVTRHYDGAWRWYVMQR